MKAYNTRWVGEMTLRKRRSPQARPYRWKSATKHWKTFKPRRSLRDLDAQYELGWRHAIGMGAELDDALALDWLQKAAEGGHVHWLRTTWVLATIRVMALMDILTAYLWFYRAAAQHDRKAAKSRDPSSVN